MILSKTELFELLSDGLMTKSLTKTRLDLYNVNTNNFDFFLQFMFNRIFDSEFYSFFADYVRTSEIELNTDYISFNNLKTTFNSVFDYELNTTIKFVFKNDSDELFYISSRGFIYKYNFNSGLAERQTLTPTFTTQQLLYDFTTFEVYKDFYYIAQSDGSLIKIKKDFSQTWLLYKFKGSVQKLLKYGNFLYIKHADSDSIELFDGENTGVFRDGNVESYPMVEVFSSSIFYQNSQLELTTFSGSYLSTDLFVSGSDEIVVSQVFDDKLFLMNPEGYLSYIDSDRTLVKVDNRVFSGQRPFLLIANSTIMVAIGELGTYTFFDKYTWGATYTINDEVIPPSILLNDKLLLSSVKNSLYEFSIDDWGTYNSNVDISKYRQVLKKVNYREIDTELKMVYVPIEIRKQLEYYYKNFNDDVKLMVLFTIMFIVIKKVNK